jgi:hypothetical protein
MKRRDRERARKIHATPDALGAGSQSAGPGVVSPLGADVGFEGRPWT